MAHVANLYCMGECASISAHEAHELAMSVAYALGISEASPNEAALVLDVDNPIMLWREAVRALEVRTDDALALWHEVMSTMPPIRNVALRDTLASLGEMKKRYDVRFAAHEIPCDIDCQLSNPVDPSLMGIDYVKAWLTQLLTEACWIARFDVDSCITILKRVCPDYRGLHVNLYDLLFPHEDELEHAKRPFIQMSPSAYNAPYRAPYHAPPVRRSTYRRCRSTCQVSTANAYLPRSAMRLRMDSLPLRWIMRELYTSLSITASARAPSDMRSCHPDGPYCEQMIIDPLR